MAALEFVATTGVYLASLLPMEISLVVWALIGSLLAGGVAGATYYFVGLIASQSGAT